MGFICVVVAAGAAPAALSLPLMPLPLLPLRATSRMPGDDDPASGNCSGSGKSLLPLSSPWILRAASAARAAADEESFVAV